MYKYICECCGGQINPATMKCEYCGTQYKQEHENIIRLETFTRPVNTYHARVSVPDSMFSSDDPHEIGLITHRAVEHLVTELSKSIAENMMVVHEHDPLLREHYLHGTIKVVRPLDSNTGGYFND